MPTAPIASSRSASCTTRPSSVVIGGRFPPAKDIVRDDLHDALSDRWLNLMRHKPVAHAPLPCCLVACDLSVREVVQQRGQLADVEIGALLARNGPREIAHALDVPPVVAAALVTQFCARIFLRRGQNARLLFGHLAHSASSGV